MKVGILPRHFNDWPIEKVLKYVSGLGYEAVEVHAWIQYGNRFADSRHINVEEILGGKATEYKRLYDQNNLIISALTDHVSTSYVLDPDESIAKKAKKRTKQLVEAAALLDVPYIVGFCGDPHWGSWYGWPPATEIWEAT